MGGGRLRSFEWTLLAAVSAESSDELEHQQNTQANMPHIMNKSARRKKFERTGGQTLHDRQRKEGYRALACGMVAVPGVAITGWFNYSMATHPVATAGAMVKPMAGIALAVGGAALSKHNWTRKIRAHSRVRGLMSS